MAKTLLKDLVGRRAKTLLDIETRGGTRIKRGTIVIIDSVWRGRFTLASTAAPKPGFGRKVLVSQVNRNNVEVIDA